jgi:hypothetical protein
LRYSYLIMLLSYIYTVANYSLIDRLCPGILG